MTPRIVSATPFLDLALAARRQALEATIDAVRSSTPTSAMQRLARASTPYRGRRPNHVRQVVVQAELVTIVLMDWTTVLSTSHRLPVMPRVGRPIDGYVI